MKYLTFCLLLTVVSFSACKKDEGTPPPEDIVTAADYYFPGKIGNHWVYKRTSEQEWDSVPRISYDTLRIVGDTVVNGITYYHLNTFVGGDVYYGDSAGTVVVLGRRGPLDEQRIAATENTVLSSDTIGDGIFHALFRTGVADTAINVPAGTLECMQVVLDFTYLISAPPAPHPNPRPAYFYYAKDIGIVRMDAWYSGSAGSETWELVEYSVN